MEEDWEALAEEKIPVVIAPVPNTNNVNKWDGEDEDEVKDSWEDEEEEGKDEEQNDQEAEVVQKTKPQKSLQKKIAEKERLKELEAEEKERERIASMTPEEKLAEKLRIQKIQEEADLRVAMDTFGVVERTGNGIDGLHPTNRAGLTELADAINQKVTLYKDLDDFAGFLEELTRSICSSLSSIDLQKIKKTIDTLYTEKQKMEKEKTKKGAKGKTKASLRMESDSAPIKEYGAYESYDYDDFM